MAVVLGRRRKVTVHTSRALKRAEQAQSVRCWRWHPVPVTVRLNDRGLYALIDWERWMYFRYFRCVFRTFPVCKYPFIQIWFANGRTWYREGHCIFVWIRVHITGFLTQVFDGGAVKLSRRLRLPGQQLGWPRRPPVSARFVPVHTSGANSRSLLWINSTCFPWNLCNVNKCSNHFGTLTPFVEITVTLGVRLPSFVVHCVYLSSFQFLIRVNFHPQYTSGLPEAFSKPQ